MKCLVILLIVLLVLVAGCVEVEQPFDHQIPNQKGPRGCSFYGCDKGEICTAAGCVPKGQELNSGLLDALGTFVPDYEAYYQWSYDDSSMGGHREYHNTSLKVENSEVMEYADEYSKKETYGEWENYNVNEPQENIDASMKAKALTFIDTPDFKMNAEVITVYDGTENGTCYVSWFQDMNQSFCFNNAILMTYAQWGSNNVSGGKYDGRVINTIKLVAEE